MTKIQVEKMAALSGHRDCIYALTGGYDEKFIFSAGADGMVARWNLLNPEIGDLIAKIPQSVYALCYIKEEEKLLIGQNFEGLRLIDLNSNKEISSIQITPSAIFDIQVWKNQVFVACGDGVLIVLDLDQWMVRKHIKTSDKSARRIAINPIERDFAVGYSDHSIRIFDLQSLELKMVIPAHNNSVFALQYSPDWKFLLSGSRDAHLKVWEVEKKYQLYESIVAHMFAINDIAFSPDGNYFATCSMDKSIKLWEYETFKLLKIIDKARHAGHGTSVNKLFWSPLEQLLVSASDDRTLSVWKVQ